jgi:hypothetical protein
MGIGSSAESAVDLPVAGRCSTGRKGNPCWQQLARRSGIALVDSLDHIHRTDIVRDPKAHYVLSVAA